MINTTNRVFRVCTKADSNIMLTYCELMIYLSMNQVYPLLIFYDCRCFRFAFKLTKYKNIKVYNTGDLEYWQSGRSVRHGVVSANDMKLIASVMVDIEKALVED